MITYLFSGSAQSLILHILFLILDFDLTSKGNPIKDKTHICFSCFENIMFVAHFRTTEIKLKN